MPSTNCTNSFSSIVSSPSSLISLNSCTVARQEVTASRGLCGAVWRATAYRPDTRLYERVKVEQGPCFLQAVYNEARTRAPRLSPVPRARVVAHSRDQEQRGVGSDKALRCRSDSKLTCDLRQVNCGARSGSQGLNEGRTCEVVPVHAAEGATRTVASAICISVLEEKVRSARCQIS